MVAAAIGTQFARGGSGLPGKDMTRALAVLLMFCSKRKWKSSWGRIKSWTNEECTVWPLAVAKCRLKPHVISLKAATPDCISLIFCKDMENDTRISSD
jgi:hypothetical protein